jgi:TonB family protein
MPVNQFANEDRSLRGVEVSRKLTVGLCCLWLVAVGGLPANPQTNASSTLGPITIGEGVLRANAESVIMPEYPAASREKHTTGVVVVQLEVTENGLVEATEILQAPDQMIKRAVEAAISQWKFRPTVLANRKRRVRGKLTFYFERVGSHFEVHNPVGY